jgi:hypothetical protein
MRPPAPAHWIARSIGSASTTPALLVLLVGLTLLWMGRADRLVPGSQVLVIAGAVTLVALGCAALAAVRPQNAGLSPPHVMLSMGFGGMLVGLLWDVLDGGTDRLASLCTQSSSLSLIDSLQLHIAYLPGMHIGMLAGGLLAIPSLRILRPHCGRYLCSLFAQNLLCSAWMLVGMTVGGLWLVRIQTQSSGSTVAGMLGGMFVGMTWGMVVSVALYRFIFQLRRAQVPDFGDKD